MKRYLSCLLLLFILIPVSLKAQDGDRGQRIQAARVAFLTERLKLTPEQAEKFWPIYNEYSAKRKVYIRQLKQVRDVTNNTLSTDAELRTAAENYFTIRENMVKLDREYYTKFQTAITIRQVVELPKAEKEFLKRILKNMGVSPDAVPDLDDME